MKRLLYIFLLITFLSCDKAPSKVYYTEPNSEAIMDNILTRRSIRKYTSQQVSTAKLEQIMKSAMYAPSANNKQPWEVRIVQNPELLEEINKRFIDWAQGKTLNGRTNQYNEPGFSIFHDAPTLIVIARDKNNPYSNLDCGIILQNILLSAHALNLGTCPLGAMVPSMNSKKNKDILELLNIPEDYEVSVNVALGYPDEVPKAPKRNPERLRIVR
ncbi:nitroreductase family protein [Mangrovimonas cancribranchiae]|uniref:Nitroreductase n=1 Tax=Mangrovimonas cancribranchiae TaxID=3080055 RepID=A0AAU6P4Q6_9FLAO